MPAELSIERDLLQYVEDHRHDLIALIQDLVRIPSENTPPSGAEAACQRYCRDYLEACGLQTDLYELSEVEGLASHPLFFPGRDYSGRPNLAATLKGGDGLSLVLSGHIDRINPYLLVFDVWSNFIRQIDVSTPRADCPCCVHKRFEFLEP